MNFRCHKKDSTASGIYLKSCLLECTLDGLSYNLYMDVSLWILIFQTVGDLDSSIVHGMGCLGSVPY